MFQFQINSVISLKAQQNHESTHTVLTFSVSWFATFRKKRSYRILSYCHRGDALFNQSNFWIACSNARRMEGVSLECSGLTAEWDGHTVPLVWVVTGTKCLWETLQESGISFQPHAAVLYGETWGNFIDSITHVGHSCLWKTHQFKGALYEQEGYTAVEWYTRC